MNSTWPIFRTEINIDLTYESFVGEITHHLDPDIRIMLVRAFYGNRASTCHFYPCSMPLKLKSEIVNKAMELNLGP